MTFDDKIGAVIKRTQLMDQVRALPAEKLKLALEAVRLIESLPSNSFPVDYFTRRRVL